MVCWTQALTRSARLSIGRSFLPFSYFIQHIALIFSRVTPPSFHQSAFLLEAIAWAPLGSGECTTGFGAGSTDPVTSALALAQPARARQTTSVDGRIGTPCVSVRPTHSRAPVRSAP